VDIKPLFGLGGILIAATMSQFNDQVTSIALTDMRGALGISHDPGTWIQSLYVSAEIVGLAISPAMMMIFTLRRWMLFAVALCGASSVLIPFSANIGAIYALRLVQGLAGGFIIPLLLGTTSRVFTPAVRLYGLAMYALTSTFTPSLAATVAALWTDVVVDWRFVFFQTIPLCLLAGILVWHFLPQDQPGYERLRMLDWRGILLLVIATGALSTMLYQGDRLDWFNSRLICVLALVSAAAIPLLLVNEWFHPLPLLKLQMFGRRNFAYGVIALFTFLIIRQSGSGVPLHYLQEVQGYRPLQSNLITLEIAAPQLVILPALALLLDFENIDSRIVSLLGMGLILTSCIGSAFVTIYWERDQFYPWQLLQAVGQPMIIMPLLMMMTNAVSPAEGHFSSALLNTSRGLAEAAGAWLLELIDRWRNALHYDRIADEAGQDRWRVIQSNGVLPQYLPPLTPAGHPRAPNSMEVFRHVVDQQVTILSTSDTFLILGALTVFLMVVVMTLPVRAVPPRIHFADH
jgi:MFS transporter, DHA2 family, multidrug resistance protein